METEGLKTDQLMWKPWLEIEDVTGECEAKNTTESLEEQNTENQTQFKYPSWQYFTYYLEPKDYLITISEEFLDSLESQDIIIPRRSDVCEYLVYHSDLLAILPSICKAANDEFSKDAQLSLEVYSDPEIDYSYLTIYVRQEEYSEQILERIKRVRVKYASKLAGKQGRILITTDFDNPL